MSPPFPRTVALFNAQDDAVAAVGIALPPRGVLPAACFRATDLWSGEQVPGTFSSTFSLPLAAHAAGLFRLQPC